MLCNMYTDLKRLPQVLEELLGDAGYVVNLSVVKGGRVGQLLHRLCYDRCHAYTCILNSY